MNTTKKSIANNLFFASVEELLAEGRCVEMIVKGFSMRPFLRNEKDVVVLAPLAGREVCVGMVVLFRYHGNYVLHRVRRVDGQTLTIEGDGNYRQTEVVTTDNVVAYVKEAVVNGGVKIRYNRMGWRCRSALSIMQKKMRTLAIDIKRKLFNHR